MGNWDNNRLAIAPDEEQRSIDIIQEANSEGLSFGTIIIGKNRLCFETYIKIVRFEISRFDRREF